MQKINWRDCFDVKIIKTDSDYGTLDVRGYDMRDSGSYYVDDVKAYHNPFPAGTDLDGYIRFTINVDDMAEIELEVDIQVADGKLQIVDWIVV